MKLNRVGDEERWLVEDTGWVWMLTSEQLRQIIELGIEKMRIPLEVQIDVNGWGGLEAVASDGRKDHLAYSDEVPAFIAGLEARVREAQKALGRPFG